MRRRRRLTNFLKQLKTIMLHASHLAISKQIGSSIQAVKSLLQMKCFDDSFNNIALAIHGGAGSMAAIPPELLDTVKFSLFLVVVTGLETLIQTRNSLEATERAVQALEDCFLFNAGKGSVHNCDGEHEMEATIMDGSTGRVGCVAGIRSLKNPVSASRKILENCRHIYLYGDGAEEFCSELERKSPSYFNTHIRYKALEKVRQNIDQGASSNTAMLRHQQTVGAVVIDQEGRLAAATSTGGTVNKMRGRIGDSSVVGAGTFADKNVAVSTTGHGEEFLRRAIAARVACQYEFFSNPDISQICKNIVNIDMKDKLAGLIAVDKNGNIGAETNAKMFYGSYKNGVITADIIDRLKMAIFEMNYKEKLNVLVHNFSTHTAFQALLYFIGWIVLLLIYLIDSSEEAKLENLDRDFVIATVTLLAYTLLTTCASCAKKTWSIFVAYLFYFVFTILAIFALGILSFGLAVDDHWEASKSTGIFVLVLIYIVILTFYLVYTIFLCFQVLFSMWQVKQGRRLTSYKRFSFY
uniref:Uncharacterized protein n=1 Tax=Acrobeloides nanus TaxID=290746 RepID=A0A914DDZ1_9BILA